MKTKLLLITFILFSYTFASAQTSSDFDKKVKAETEKMASALDLTDDQKVTVYRQNYTLMDQQKRFDNVANKTDEMKAAMESYKEDYKKNIEKLLTDSQRELFKSYSEKSKLLKK